MVDHDTRVRAEAHVAEHNRLDFELPGGGRALFTTRVDGNLFEHKRANRNYINSILSRVNHEVGSPQR